MKETKTGSAEHKQQVCEDLIRQYQENIWKDEVNLIILKQEREQKQAQIREIEAALEAKKYATKNEGEKAKFVVEREILKIDESIAVTAEKVNVIWPARIATVKEYMNT